LSCANWAAEEFILTHYSITVNLIRQTFNSSCLCVNTNCFCVSIFLLMIVHTKLSNLIIVKRNQQVEKTNFFRELNNIEINEIGILTMFVRFLQRKTRFLVQRDEKFCITCPWQNARNLFLKISTHFRFKS